MNLAPYATRHEESRGRLTDEGGSAHRSAYQRDRDRIIHSSSFRRLKHKTQVFVEHEGDYYRTRLTHSIEVAQVARTIARTLGLNEDLTEAVALAHDLGHTPFGHTGEDALDECMKPYGGFDHNAQAIKIVTSLERHYAEWDGLNLTWETLEGIAKHNGPLIGPGLPELPYALAEYNEIHDLEMHTYASAEAQVAALADDIAYNNHDLDDGLRSLVLKIEDVEQLPIVGEQFWIVDREYPDLDKPRRRHEALRRFFGVLVTDVLEQSQFYLNELGPQSAQDVRMLGQPVVRFSPDVWEQLKVVRAFMFEKMYRHWAVRRMRRKSKVIVREIFEEFMDEPEMLPNDWRPMAMEASDAAGRARVISDYIAGMTDRYALQEHRKLTDPLSKA